VGVVRLGRSPEAPLLPSDDAALSHQALDAFLPDAQASLAKRAMHPRAAVPLAALGVSRGDFDRELRVLLGAGLGARCLHA